ncbi:MAG: Crp/Fnr family transcriptional regulator [Pyrinomonadaceae bacterium]|nr:Crp/Fnr family transcriptional regulator [Pyrinomonadaceae bacterium]
MLSKTECRNLFELSKIIEFDVDSTVYEYGDSVKHLVFPIDAVFSTSTLMEDGSSAETSLIGSEGAIGIQAIFDSDFTARQWTNVLIAGRALKVEVSILKREIARNERLRLSLLEFYLQLMAQVSQRAVCNGRHSLAQRFCFWLLLVQDRVKSNEIALTHELIAKKLGARRAGITNVAGDLQSANAIKYTRGIIRIVNRQIIKNESCECYQAVANALAVRV